MTTGVMEGSSGVNLRQINKTHLKDNELQQICQLKAQLPKPFQHRCS